MTAVGRGDQEDARCRSQGSLFVLDEAYIEFADESVADGMTLLDEYLNLMVCRTFSKVYGLAGLRVGWIAGDAELMRYLYNRVSMSSLPAAAGAKPLSTTPGF